jgi:hypothetical protein
MTTSVQGMLETGEEGDPQVGEEGKRDGIAV